MLSSYVKLFRSLSHKEHARLLELLTQVQVAIDGVQSVESVRPHRKTQTNRVQKLITALEGVDKNSRRQEGVLIDHPLVLL
ncbi:unnamed protein product [Calypogeia fissa]